MNLVFLLSVCLIWSQPALAYIDPVNGAMLLQLLLSGITGAVLVFRRVLGEYFERVKARWKAKSNE